MAYTAHKPSLPVSIDELSERIPGWGADLDPNDRPSVPRLDESAGRSGAHWEVPERQPELTARERSIEHSTLPPVFGTACPPKALSGLIRRLAYRRYSEARAAHWLLLLAADRVDVAESRFMSLLRLRPDVPVVETGLRSELTHGGLSSRLRRRRADVRHQGLDPLVVASPWLVGLAVAARAGRGSARRSRRFGIRRR